MPFLLGLLIFFGLPLYALYILYRYIVSLFRRKSDL